MFCYSFVLLILGLFLQKLIISLLHLIIITLLIGGQKRTINNRVMFRDHKFRLNIGTLLRWDLNRCVHRTIILILSTISKQSILQEVCINSSGIDLHVLIRRWVDSVSKSELPAVVLIELGGVLSLIGKTCIGLVWSK